MNDTLSRYLKAIGAYQLHDIVERAAALFDEYEIDYEASYFNHMSQHDTMELHDELMGFVSITEDFLNQVLTGFNVRLSNDAKTIDRIKIAESLGAIVDYEDREMLMGIFGNRDATAIDRAALLLELTSPYDLESLYLLLEHAELDYLKERIDFTPPPPNPEDADYHDARPDLLVRVKKFRRMIFDDELFMIKSIINGTPIGSAFSFYVEMLRPVLLTLDAPEAAKNMIMAALMSSDASNNIATVWKDTINDIVSDSDLIMRSLVVMNKMLTEFQQYEKA